jgi:phosphoribosylformylglycinamidine synthase
VSPSFRDIAEQGSESPPDLLGREERSDAAVVFELWPDRIGGRLGGHRWDDGLSVERVALALGVRWAGVCRRVDRRGHIVDQEVRGSVEQHRREAGEQVVKAKIHVTLKQGILDPQGKAIEHALDSLGFKNVENVRVGKYMELDLQQTDKAKAEVEVKQMCEKLLANTIIEEYRYELQG